MTGLKQILHSRCGFTLVELIVVLVILGVVGSISVPALTGYIDNAKEKQAVSETQACVAAATDMGAKQYAKAQKLAIENSVKKTSSEGDPNSNNLYGWISVGRAETPEVSGDVALTEGTGKYLLHVTSKLPNGNINATAQVSWAGNNSVKSQVPVQASVSGTVSKMTYNASGQVLYLVYTSADGIQVVYTATGTTYSAGSDTDTVVVPKPDDSTKPDPEPDTPVVPPQPDAPTIQVTIKKISSYTEKNLSDAKLCLTKAEDTSYKLEWTTTGSSQKPELTAGTYTLTETEAPNGYNVTSPITFTVAENATGKLTVSGSNVSDNTVTMTDTVRTSPFIFWASDEDGNTISGMYLQITGGMLGKRPGENSDKDKDTHWISSATDGHTLDLPLTPGTYTFELNSEHRADQNPQYEIKNLPKVKITIANDGTVSYDGDAGEYKVTNDGTYTGIHLIFKKKASPKNNQLVIEDDGIRVTIDNIKPWPITKSTDSAYIQKGEFYYYDNGDERTFYAACPENSTTVTGSASTPTSVASLCSVTGTGFAKVFTDSTMAHIQSQPDGLSDVRSGDLYYHNGVLYMFCNAAGNLTNCSTPEKEPARWIDLSQFGYKIDISIKEVPVSIQLVDEDTGNVLSGFMVLLKNPKALSQNLATTDTSGALLHEWTISATPYECKLVPGTYKLAFSQYYDDHLHQKVDTEFTVTDSDSGQVQKIEIKLPLKTKDLPVTLLSSVGTGTSAVTDYTFILKGTKANGQLFSTIAISNKQGIATFKDIPYGTYSFDFTSYPKGSTYCEGNNPVQINDFWTPSATLTFKR